MSSSNSFHELVTFEDAIERCSEGAPLFEEKVEFITHFAELLRGKRDTHFLLAMCAQQGRPFGAEELYSGMEGELNTLITAKMKLFRRIRSSEFDKCLSIPKKTGILNKCTWREHGLSAITVEKLSGLLPQNQSRPARSVNYLDNESLSNVVLRNGRAETLEPTSYRPGSLDASFADDALCRQVGPELYRGENRSSQQIELARAVCKQCVVSEQCIEYWKDHNNGSRSLDLAAMPFNSAK